MRCLKWTLYIHTVMKEALMYLLDSSQSLSSSEESSESCSPSLVCSSSFLIGTRLKSSAWDSVTVMPLLLIHSIRGGLSPHHHSASSRESQLLFFIAVWRWPHTWWPGFPCGLVALLWEKSKDKFFQWPWTVASFWTWCCATKCVCAFLSSRRESGNWWLILQNPCNTC